jgi:hypothetical protein
MLNKLNSLHCNFFVIIYVCLLYILYNIIFQDVFAFTYCDSIVESSFNNNYGSDVCLNNHFNIETNSNSREMETFSIESKDAYCLNSLPNPKDVIKSRLY